MNTVASYPSHTRLLSERVNALDFLSEQCRQIINWLGTSGAPGIDTGVANYHRHDTRLESDNLAILKELASLNI